MDRTTFATWKYQHAGAGYRHRARVALAAALLVAALVAGTLFADKSMAPAIILFLLALVTYFHSRKVILVGPRYFICGNVIVYYANVTRMALNDGAGTLRLVTASGQNFTLERDNFPTGARKADKITKNKAAKFAKVSANLIAKVQRASPAVETMGMARSRGAATP
jgi:hypothetical protein